VSSLHRLSSAAEVRAQVTCMCSAGDACTAFAPGHAVHLIQARLASATPSEWIDALVEDVDVVSGVLSLRTLDADASVEVWSAAGAADSVTAGSPVAVHARYHLLIAGERRYNVAVLPAQQS